MQAHSYTNFTLHSFTRISIKKINFLSIPNYITILCNTFFLISVKGLFKQNKSYTPYFKYEIMKH